MWPKILLLPFGHRPEKENDKEYLLFQKSLHSMSCELIKHGWSWLVITPEVLRDLTPSLPEFITVHAKPLAVRSLVMKACAMQTTLWVEKSDIAALVAGYVVGGLRKDALDSEIQDLQALERHRICDPLVVVGNSVKSRGGSYESDVLGISAGSPALLELLSLICHRVVCRGRRARATGPHWTIQESWCEWAASHHLQGQNIVSRWIGSKETCRPPADAWALTVRHQGSWCKYNKTPASWLAGKTFCARSFSPQDQTLLVSVLKRPSSEEVKGRPHGVSVCKPPTFRANGAGAGVHGKTKSEKALIRVRDQYWKKCWKSKATFGGLFGFIHEMSSFGH